MTLYAICHRQVQEANAACDKQHIYAQHNCTALPARQLQNLQHTARVLSNIVHRRTLVTCNCKADLFSKMREDQIGNCCANSIQAPAQKPQAVLAWSPILLHNNWFMPLQDHHSLHKGSSLHQRYQITKNSPYELHSLLPELLFVIYFCC